MRNELTERLGLLLGEMNAPVSARSFLSYSLILNHSEYQVVSKDFKAYLASESHGNNRTGSYGTTLWDAKKHGRRSHPESSWIARSNCSNSVRLRYKHSGILATRSHGKIERLAIVSNYYVQHYLGPSRFMVSLGTRSRLDHPEGSFQHERE